MCAIKHINFEFVFNGRHFAAHPHAQLQSKRIVYHEPVDCRCRWQSNPPQTESLSLSHVSIHGNVRVVDMFSSRISTSKWSTYHFGNTSKFYAFCCHFNTDVAERDIPMNNLWMWAEMRKNVEYDMRQSWYEAVDVSGGAPMYIEANNHCIFGVLSIRHALLMKSNDNMRK